MANKGGTGAVEYRFGRFRLQPAVRRLLRDGEAVNCPRRVFDLLTYLVEQRDRAVGRDELVSAVWGRVDVTDVQLGQIVLRARRAVDDDGTAQHSIATVAGFGYHWIAPTQAADEAAAAGAPADEAAPARVAATPPRASRLVALATAVVLAAVAGTAWLWRDPAPPPAVAPANARGDAAVILPLATSQRPEEAWARLGGMDLVAERLRAGGLAVPTSESVLGVIGGAGEAHKALRAAFGDAALVEGRARREDDGTWTFELVARPAGGMVLPVSVRRADPVAAARDAADLLLAALGREPPGDPSGARDTDEDWQRARAALLANETETARAILVNSSHYAAKPGERAVHLAQVDFREGKLAAADAAMSELLAQLAPGDDDLLRTRALIVRGATRSRLGDFRAAWTDYDAALAASPRDMPAIERARALSGRGSSAVPAHRFDAALADMGEARSLFAAAGDVFGAARVDANLGMLEAFRARPAAALGYLEAAAGRLDTLGAQHEWQIVQAARVEAHLALLQYPAADAVAEAMWERRERSRDSEQRIDIGLHRAHVRLATGRYREAAALLADPQNDAAQNPVLRANLASLRAALAWRQSRREDAAALAHAALAAWPAQGAGRERDAVALIERRALRALGRPGAAMAMPAPDEPVLPADLTWRELDGAEEAAARGDAEAAQSAYRAARDAAEQSGVPVIIAAVAASAVPWFAEHGRLDEARALAGRIAPWAAQDFDCAVVQWQVLRQAPGAAADAALAQARALAGERPIPGAP